MKCIRSVSNFIDLLQFHLICQMLAKFSRVKSERTVSKFTKKKKENFVLTYFVKRVHEIKKFHVAVLQRRLRTYKKRNACAELFFC